MNPLRIAAIVPLAALLAAMALAAMPSSAVAGEVGVAVRIGPIELYGVHGLSGVVGRIDLGALPLPPLPPLPPFLLPRELRMRPTAPAQPPGRPWRGPRADGPEPGYGGADPGDWEPPPWRADRRYDDRGDGRRHGHRRPWRDERREGWRQDRHRQAPEEALREGNGRWGDRRGGW